MHYLIIIIIIAIIVFIQLHFFLNTKQKATDFLRIFPDKGDQYKLRKEALKEQICAEKEISDAENYNSQEIAFINKEKSDDISKVSTETGISVSHNSGVLKTIIDSINDYLNNNKTVSDFHLMKDIVDRNCDAKEEEINTQIPVPLYMGLVGTMAGILIGVGYLVFSGDLSALLNVDIPQWFKNSYENIHGLGGSELDSAIRSAWSTKGSEGVVSLLGGISIAMISSILGIILTTWSSNKFKTVKSIVERHKHVFLSWIQKTLLPTLSDNIVGAIREMTGNLENFNREFAQNTGNLGLALGKVNESYEMQVLLLDSVSQIADKDLTKQNLKLYTALQNSTEEIGTLAEYLKNCNQYLANVQALNKKLDDHENRTQFIENASKFYSKHENWLTENYDEANRKLQEVVGKYNTAIEGTFSTIKSDIEGKRQELGIFIDNQNTALKSSTGDLDKIVKAISELGEVQNAVKAFEPAIKGQNAKIDRLAEHIEKLANAKSNGVPVQIQQKTPIWQIALIGVIALSCTVLAVSTLFGINGQ